MKEKALVLDFGGVITKTVFETHRLTEQILGLPANSLTWYGPFDVSSDPLWVSMCNDEISERDYYHQRVREVASLVGESWTEMSQFIIAVRGDNIEKMIRPEALFAINKAAESGAKLAILSNELDLFYGAELRSKLPFLENFEVIVDATYSKILKPDPRAYQLCVDQLGLSFENCVFVDDQFRNIQGATNVGMQTVHFDVRQPADSYQRTLSLLAKI